MPLLLQRLTRWEASCSSGGPDLCLAALEAALTPLLLRTGLSRGRRRRSTTRSGALARRATPGGTVWQEPEHGASAQRSSAGTKPPTPAHPPQGVSTSEHPPYFYKLIENQQEESSTQIKYVTLQRSKAIPREVYCQESCGHENCT